MGSAYQAGDNNVRQKIFYLKKNSSNQS